MEHDSHTLLTQTQTRVTVDSVLTTSLSHSRHTQRQRESDENAGASGRTRPKLLLCRSSQSMRIHLQPSHDVPLHRLCSPPHPHITSGCRRLEHHNIRSGGPCAKNEVSAYREESCVPSDPHTMLQMMRTTRKRLASVWHRSGDATHASSNPLLLLDPYS